MLSDSGEIVFGVYTLVEGNLFYANCANFHELDFQFV